MKIFDCRYDEDMLEAKLKENGEVTLVCMECDKEWKKEDYDNEERYLSMVKEVMNKEMEE